MNMNPDETTLALWLEDELTGEELAAVEAWAGGHPEHLAAREQTRRWRATLTAVMPASIEPPYPDFFNHRVMQALQSPASPPEIIVKKSFFRTSWFMPAAACAGMALTFWVGKKSQSPPDYEVASVPRAIPVEEVVYTPENGVNAEWFASTKASATVIVLNGVTAIPDTTNFPETASVPVSRENEATAEIETQPTLATEP
jgi:hypothetical protein